MDWLFDPTAWVGLVTLVVLEIVLGVDNLIFIAIITDKLPPERRGRARLIGLSLALGMRLALLASISWIVTLTRPLFTVAGFEVSGRQLILLVGGLFLIWKATTELHERLEGASQQRSGPTRNVSFWQVVAQIVVLDAVFSLDSVITAVGMVDELGVMMTAVIIAVIIMMVASRPLMDFVSAHPTVVILCLGFLLMIGFSLGAEGLGFHIPKSYLYAAIAFSILIEVFNQVALRNRRRKVRSGDLRQRTADAVLRLLGARELEPATPEDVAAIAAASPEKVFAPEERRMIAGVLDLATREVRSLMTPFDKIVWLDRDEPESELRRRILAATHTRYPVARGGPGNLTGVALTQELLCGLLNDGRLSLSGREREPLVVPRSMSVLDVVERLRDSPVQMAVVRGDSGQVEGIVTPMDVLQAIVGDMPEEGQVRRPQAQPA
jgi:predicted tellurium resistance membrane protein TerC/CBS domain-containing protein